MTTDTRCAEHNIADCVYCNESQADTRLTVNLGLDEADVKILLGGMRSYYRAVVDAVHARAGAPSGYDWPRREPMEIDSCIDKMDRIERMCAELGESVGGLRRRRETAVKYWRAHEAIWSAEQMLASGNRVEVGR